MRDQPWTLMRVVLGLMAGANLYVCAHKLYERQWFDAATALTAALLASYILGKEAR